MSRGFSGLVLPRPRRVTGWVAARAHASQIGASTAARVVEQFGAELLGRPTNLSLTWRNRLVVVRTTAGRRVLKEYRETSSFDAITHEHSIIDHLEGRDFPSTRLEHTPSGDSIVDEGGHWYALFRFEPGRQMASTFLLPAHRRALLEEAGRTMARLHRELEGFRPAGKHHLGHAPDAIARDRDLAWHLATLDHLVDETAAPADQAAARDVLWLRARADALRSDLLDVGDRVQEASLPRVVIHGDYGTHNLLFRPDGTALVHDFELARFDWRLLDVVIASLRMPPAIQDTFIAGYRQVSDLSREELRILPWLWRYHLLSGAVRSWRMFQELGGPARLTTARARLLRAEAGPGEALARWR